jgi:hypothetical protein
MRHYRRNADPRLRDLQRRLAESPADIELQHATLIATVRAGELPHEAAERLTPNRPVQPWQWIPASYVLLAAERLGRESEWQEGKVQIDWISDARLMELTFGDDPGQKYRDASLYPAASLPYWGIEGERAMVAGARKASMTHPEDWTYFNPAPYRKTFVGAHTVDWDHTRIIAGLDPKGSPAPSPSQEYQDYVLSALPPRWIPNLDHLAATEDMRDATPGWPIYLDDVWTARKFGEPYSGPYPDAYDPQVLLYAARRVVRKGRSRHALARFRGGERALQQGGGPLLDVRLINRVRIMEKRGKRWV